MSNQLNFSQQMDEVLKTLGDTRPPAAAPCLLRPLFQRRAGAAVPVFRHHRALLQPQYMARRRIPPPGRRAGALRRRRPPAGRDGGGRPVRPQEFYSAVAGLENEPERGGRCTVCYRLRMRRAAQYAAEHGFDWFTTTLSISPTRTPSASMPSGRSWSRSMAFGTCPPTSKSRTAICARCSSQRNTASTVRITAAVSSAQRHGE